jgi:hypothetical protein
VKEGKVAERRWTLDGAREILPEVRERTARAVESADALVAQRDELPEDSEERADVEKRIQAGVSRWMREMEALGLEVKGVWLVDFDSGGGYYCWKWPEESLDWFHTYEEGFAGRTRIQ